MYDDIYDRMVEAGKEMKSDDDEVILDKDGNWEQCNNKWSCSRKSNKINANKT